MAGPRRKSSKRAPARGSRRGRPPASPAAAGPKFGTQAALARHLGVTRNAVYRAKRDGRIKVVDGLVDLAQAERDWLHNTDPVRRVRKATGAPAPKQDADSLQLHKETQRLTLAMRRIEMAKELEQLVAAREFLRGYREMLTSTVKNLLTLDARLAPQVVGLTDPREARQVIRREVEIMVREIAEFADGEDTP